MCFRLIEAEKATNQAVNREGVQLHSSETGCCESWFSKLKQRCVWRQESETLDQARAATGAYVERHHLRPHQFLSYRTPNEVRQSWEMPRKQKRLDERLRLGVAVAAAAGG